MMIHLLQSWFIVLCERTEHGCRIHYTAITALCISQWGAGSIPANPSILEGNPLNERSPDLFQDIT